MRRTTLLPLAGLLILLSACTDEPLNPDAASRIRPGDARFDGGGYMGSGLFTSGSSTTEDSTSTGRGSGYIGTGL